MPKKQLIYLNNLWKRKDRLNVAKILFELPNSKVLFPNCEDAFLDVKDIYFDELNADWVVKDTYFPQSVISMRQF